MSNANAASLASFIQPPNFDDQAEQAAYSRGNFYAANGMYRLRKGADSDRYQTVSQDLGMYMCGQRCADGSSVTVDGVCPLVGGALAPPSVMTTAEEASNQLDSMFVPYVMDAIPETSPAAKFLIGQRGPVGSVYGRLA